MLKPISACIASLQKLDRSLTSSELVDIVGKASEKVKAVMELLAPGSIKTDIVTEVRTGPAINEATGKIGPSTKTDWKANFIEKGVRATMVRVKQKQVLADKAAGKMFGTRANIPARPARPFIEPAARLSQYEVDRTFEQEIDALVREAFGV